MTQCIVVLDSDAMFLLPADRFPKLLERWKAYLAWKASVRDPDLPYAFVSDLVDEKTIGNGRVAFLLSAVAHMAIETSGSRAALDEACGWDVGNPPDDEPWKS